LVDIPLILKKLSKLEEYYKQIEEFKGITLNEYSNDWKIQRIVERTLQIMIETCVDIANHIIADNRLRIPESYADTFKVLHENTIVSDDLFNTMNKMVKFRNVVVHQYSNVNAEIVIVILKKHREDFMKYRDAIVMYLKNHGFNEYHKNNA